MKTLEERAKEAEARITPILAELNVMLTAKALINAEGKVTGEVQWVDTYKEPVSDFLPDTALPVDESK